MTGVQAFDCFLQLYIGDAVRKYALQSRLSKFGPVAGVTQVMRDKIEALRLGRAIVRWIDGQSIDLLWLSQPA